MATPERPLVGLGEVLWDLFPAGRQLGGAPFNFTFHCHQLGHPAVMVSRVGADARGQAIRAEVTKRGLSDAWIQTDLHHLTGTVTVVLDDQGQPVYTITPDVAYDFLTWDDALHGLFSKARAVCFGTLAQRHPVSRQTIQQSLHHAVAQGALVVCDINLRQHFFSREIIEESLRLSRWAKLNEDELTVLRDMLGVTGKGPTELMSDLRHRYELELVALTRGGQGCLVQTEADEVDLPGVPVRVVDTVGAGDAFTAGLLAATVEGQSVTEAARFANCLAACVASKPGGAPVITREELR
jgi:fructokinase